MQKLNLSLSISVLTALGAFSCAGDPDATVTAVEVDAAQLAQRLVPTDEASTPDDGSFFRLERDVRRCAFPRCGGFFVSRVNRLTTECSDGVRRRQCYVSELGLDASGLAGDQRALVLAAPETFVVRGEIASQSSELGEVGRLDVSEAWHGHAGVTPRGAFLRARNEGIVCITNPCLSFSAEVLNSSLPDVAISSVDVQGISDDPSDAFEQLSSEDGLIVAALPFIERGPAGSALGLDASEYYVRLRAGGICGTRGAPPCADGSFCNFPPESSCGRADGPGVCEPLPEACIEIFAPVCGCDGQTYDNACFANAAGVSAETEGPCATAEPPGELCGSRGLPECAAGSFCAFPPESDCGRADAPGTCAFQPEVCIQLFDPVCGCDGQTYGNSCVAASAGVSVDFAGPCEEVEE